MKPRPRSPGWRRRCNRIHPLPARQPSQTCNNQAIRCQGELFSNHSFKPSPYAMSTSIIVVEDEPAIQELISVNLSFAGHKVLRAFDAEQAQVLIRAELPDLILVDWMLPGSSGISLARKLRTDERTRHIPVIMLTAKGSEQDKVDGLEAGADDYITKPFSPKELIARIKAVLRRRAPQLTDDMITIGNLQLDPGTHRLSSDGLALTIGPTEFRLLHFFMTHTERVFTRSQLL